ncbi:MAG TPA: L,D-transpeptidase family protein [Gammaproteobacteria bacterium]|nr:L,D-transpeptidase family protein [Gammaproteobacteria bacterium]
MRRQVKRLPGIRTRSHDLIPLVVLTLLSGCGMLEGLRPEPADALPQAPLARSAPLITDRFELGPGAGDVVGTIQIVEARHEDTLLDLARAYGLGYDEIVAANPGVNPWLPGEGTTIVLPTQFVLPQGEREGIVLNVATRRLFYFPQSEPGAVPVVLTHPVGIGRVGWNTPVGTTEVVAKARDPIWWVPASVRKEHAEMGDPLPARVPPGPDNPLGHRVLQLGMPGYLIHGTNRPDGIGMRVSHGCMQLFPEDIERLYEITPVGTPVRIINDPYPTGWQDGRLYLDAHPPLEDDPSDHGGRLRPLLNAMAAAAADAPAEIDWDRVAALLEDARGFPVPVTGPETDAEAVLARAQPVDNIVIHAPPDLPSGGGTAVAH